MQNLQKNTHLETNDRVDFWGTHYMVDWGTNYMVDSNQTLTTNCEVITKWNDVFLVWDPEE